LAAVVEDCHLIVCLHVRGYPASIFFLKNTLCCLSFITINIRFIFSDRLRCWKIATRITPRIV